MLEIIKEVKQAKEKKTPLWIKIDSKEQDLWLTRLYGETAETLKAKGIDGKRQEKNDYTELLKTHLIAIAELHYKEYVAEKEKAQKSVIPAKK